jgi:hypothetical protein
MPPGDADEWHQREVARRPHVRERADELRTNAATQDGEVSGDLLADLEDGNEDVPDAGVRSTIGATVTSVTSDTLPASPQASRAVGATGSVRYAAVGNATVGEGATSGSVTVSFNQWGDGGGVIGSYDLIFGLGSDAQEEQGTFVAPTCNICAVEP